MGEIDERYKRGKIYTVRCRYDDSLIYVGSTINLLAKRMGMHRRDKTCSLYKQVDGDWNNWYIELYEEFPCNNKQLLQKREGEVIREIGTINNKIAGRTVKEYYIDNREKKIEKAKEYYEANKEILNQKAKEYYEANKEELKEKAKEYRENNKEIISEYRENNKEIINKKAKEYRENNKEIINKKAKEYYESNKDKITEYQKKKVICDICGCESFIGHLKRHQKSKKCMNYNK
jgi:hypothetical protein